MIYNNKKMIEIAITDIPTSTTNDPTATQDMTSTAMLTDISNSTTEFTIITTTPPNITNTDGNTQPSGGLSDGGVAAIVIVLLLLIVGATAAAVVIVLLVWHKKRKSFTLEKNAKRRSRQDSSFGKFNSVH